MTHSPTRRRFIGISAAAAGLAILPFGRGALADAELVAWRGQALGATCTLQIHHRDPQAGQRLVTRVISEVRRLERMFSLYDQASTLSQLNRSGVVVAPPPEFSELLAAARGFSRDTDGAFDVTVQPLGQLFAAHFSRPGADPAGPPQESVHEALARVGTDRMVIGPGRVALRRGMAVTFNGIAQGFVTDKVVDLLRNEGVDRSLVDMGETRVLGLHPGGRAWEAAVEDPDHPAHAMAILPLVDRALATSGPYGFRFDPEGRFNHLFTPATGACAQDWKSVSVIAQTATAADALSTAFTVMTEPAIRAVARKSELDLVLLVDRKGRETRIVV